jgi:hypothetical protein
MARRIIFALLAVVLALAPLTALVASQPANAAGVSIQAKCMCHDCDGGACPGGTSCAFACALSTTAIVSSASDAAPDLASQRLASCAGFALTGLAWPPPLQPPTV